MEPEKEDQSQEVEKSEETKTEDPKSMFGKDGYWDKGMKFLEEEEIAKEESEKVTEEECPDCPKKEEGKEPILVIERKGKKIPIYTQEQLKEYASKGLDYTVKTQELAEDKRKVESQLDEKMSMISDLAKRINLAFEQNKKIGADGREPEPEKKEPTLDDYYEQYGLDEFSDPVQRKMVADMFELQSQVKTLKQTNQANKDMLDLFTTKEAVVHIGSIIEEARKEYPFEEVMDENGKNLTARQFVRMFKAKTDEPENKGRPIGEVAREAVKELYFIQKAKKAEGLTEQEVKKMTVDDFARRYPEIATKLKEQGVADHLAEVQASPPDLRPKKREVDLSKIRGGKDQPQSLNEYLDRAEKDPEIVF